MFSPRLPQERVHQLGQEVMSEVVDSEVNLKKEKGLKVFKYVGIEFTTNLEVLFRFSSLWHYESCIVNQNIQPLFLITS